MKPMNVVIKSVPRMRVIAVRVSSAEDFDPLFQAARGQVTAFAAAHNVEVTGPLMGVFYEDLTDPDCDCDFAVALPTNSSVQAEGAVTIQVLPAVDRMATYILSGSPTPEEADEVYERLIAWIEAHSYRIDGPYREIFCEGQGASGPAIEIQFPVRSRAIGG